ncbi:MAG: hypothetical protein ACJ8GK_01720, partial [Luteimonas sp.]
DLAALQHWLQQRPAAKTRIPTLTDGLRISDGTLLGEDWRLVAIELRLPALAPARRVSANVAARYLGTGLQVPFDLDVVMSAPAPEAAIGVAGKLAIERPGWTMPAHVVLSGALRSAPALQLQRMRLSVSARYDAGAAHVPFALGAGGTLRLDGGLRLAPAAISLRAHGLVPALDANGTLALGDALGIALDGALATWPAAWPELPAPLGRSRSPLPFKLRYSGKSDLSDITLMELRDDQVRFDGRFRLDDVASWIGSANTSPLPPLEGRLQAPWLEIAGARLEGVQATLDDGTVPGTASAATP